MHYTESTQSIHRKIPIPPCSSVTLTWSIPHPRRPTSRQQKLSTIWSHNLFVPPDTAGHQLLINTKPAFKQQYSQYSSLYTRVIASSAILAPKLGYTSELQLNICPLLLYLHNVYATCGDFMTWLPSSYFLIIFIHHEWQQQQQLSLLSTHLQPESWIAE